MTEEQELQAKIAALAGRINVHKQRATQSNNRPSHKGNIATRHGKPTWVPKAGTPYGYNAHHPYKPHVPSHRHRSLIMNHPVKGSSAANTDHNTTNSDGETTSTSAGDSSHATAWVSKRDRHLQLINRNVYDRINEERNTAIANTAKQKQDRRDALEKAKLNEYFQAKPEYQPGGGSNITKHRVYELQVEGISFQVVDGGSRLIKIPNDTADRITPKTAQVGGVMFYRGKDGNLYRGGLVKAKTSQHIGKVDGLCPKFTTTGLCLRGPNCRFEHDPNKVAICKEFLQKGVCPLDDCCDLSHDPTPHRVPACVHFLRGNCTNNECRYAHVKVNPAAPVCAAYARFGYCDLGAECTSRHVSECPDYANQGSCRLPNCRLPHVDRAGQIRKVFSVDTEQEVQAADLNEFTDEEDVDFDMDLEAAEGGTSEASNTGDRELQQQHDFIRF